MRKLKKLALSRETLLQLEASTLRNGLAGGVTATCQGNTACGCGIKTYGLCSEVSCAVAVCHEN